MQRILKPKNFYEYWITRTPKEKKALAAGAGTNYKYLCNVAGGGRRLGADLIERLMIADSRLTFRLLRAKGPRPIKSRSKEIEARKLKRRSR